MASTSLMQQSGGFAPVQIQTIKAPYCNQVAGGGIAVGQTVYEVISYVDGVKQLPAAYESAASVPLALSAAQIAALVPGECGRAYDQEGDLVCAAGVTLKRIEVYNNSPGGTGPTGIPVVVFANPITNVAVPTPAVWTFGACARVKAPVTARTYVSAAGAIAVPANARREVVVFNRSTRDLLITWTSSIAGGGGTFTVPARGFYTLSLTEEPSEGVITGMTLALDAGGVGLLTTNSVIFDWKN